jgi:hypothetical protein
MRLSSVHISTARLSHRVTLEDKRVAVGSSDFDLLKAPIVVEEVMNVLVMTPIEMHCDSLQRQKTERKIAVKTSRRVYVCVCVCVCVCLAYARVHACTETPLSPKHNSCKQVVQCRWRCDSGDEHG